MNLVKYSHKQEVLRMFYTKPLSHPRFERTISRDGERYEKENNDGGDVFDDVLLSGRLRGWRR